MHREYNEYAREALDQAREASASCFQNYIGTEHLLLGLVSVERSLAGRVLAENGLSKEVLIDAILKRSAARGDLGKVASPGYSPRAQSVLDESEAEAARFEEEEIGTEHILLSLLKERDCIAARLLTGLNINIKKVYTDILITLGMEPGMAQKEFQFVMGQGSGAGQPSTIEIYCEDLTALAREGRLDPVVGRKEEMSRVIRILSRRTKNSPVLVGEPGVGKTAIVEGLAQWIVRGEVPLTMEDKKLLKLDLPGLVAGSRYRGEFEERIKKLLTEVMMRGDILLFVDEIHTMIGAGGAEGSIDASNIIKPFLARGELQLIGATTREEYRKYVEKDAAFERRFQPVAVDEPSEEETLEILTGLKDQFETFHHVRYSKGALQAAVRMSDRYISDRFLPDKAIDVMDEAASRKRVYIHTMPEEIRRLDEEIEKTGQRREEALLEGNMRKARLNHTKYQKAVDKRKDLFDAWEAGKQEKQLTVTEKDMAEVVSSWTGIPVTRLSQAESQRLLHLEDTLKKRVIGQDEAVELVAKAIKRGRVGMKDPRRPIGSFMFLGPTGVGKTELSKALSEALFGDEKAMIRVDMSEYMEKHSVSKMIGSPPGYVGYDDGGQLSEQVRRHPYSVLLFDEIEKAHPDVFNILLQVLDEGQITDSNGRKVDFKNTVVIMTSNAGAQRIIAPKNLGFAATVSEQVEHEKMQSRVMEEVKKLFRPEFLNRIDGVVVFHTLEKPQQKRIVRLLLKEMTDRIQENPGFTLKVSDQVADYILEKGYQPQYGARPLKRTIQNELEDFLADEYLKGHIKKNSVVELVMKDGAPALL